MNPIVGLGLTQLKGQAMHSLEGIGLLIDENKEQLIFQLRQATFRATPNLAAACVAIPGFVQRIAGGIGGLKGWQQQQKLFMCQSSCAQKLSWPIFQGGISYHTVIIHYLR